MPHANSVLHVMVISLERQLEADCWSVPRPPVGDTNYPSSITSGLLVKSDSLLRPVAQARMPEPKDLGHQLKIAEN